MNGDHNDDMPGDVASDGEREGTFRMNIALPVDEDGYTGRECPNPDCEGYFKVTFGTGLAGASECCCPYCGRRGEQNEFFTKAQVEFIQSTMLNGITAELIAQLKKSEFDYRAQGPFGIGFSLKVEGTLPPIAHYREERLETEVICSNCTLRYAIYGVFAFCPDCGIHNSLQILEKNIELAEKEAALASTVEGELAVRLIEDALENEVSSFDGFGRETCRVNASIATTPAKVGNLSFQSLRNAQDKVQRYFSYDLASPATSEEWTFACRCFQKRHLLAHKLGVVDDDYVKSANDPDAVVGHRISIASDEVTRLAIILRQMGIALVKQLVGAEKQGV